MATPLLTDLAPDSPLHAWLPYYCRLGYEVTRACRGPQDPDPWCQRLAARRQVLRQAAQQHLRQVYALDEPQAQHLFAQWSQQVFRQLLTAEAMGQLDLEAALTEALPT